METSWYHESSSVWFWQSHSFLFSLGEGHIRLFHWRLIFCSSSNLANRCEQIFVFTNKQNISTTNQTKSQRQKQTVESCSDMLQHTPSRQCCQLLHKTCLKIIFQILYKLLFWTSLHYTVMFLFTGPRLYKQPATKSNRGIMLNAVEYCVFPGVVNKEAKRRVLEEIARSESKHFLILFRDAGCQFRALYSYCPEQEEVCKLYGTGPKQVNDRMFDKFFK